MKERRKKEIAATTVPTTIYGVRRPKRLFVLSEIAPNTGSRKRAIRLSRAMIMPDQVCAMPNLLVRISGTSVSYACQNIEMRKKAKPTHIVFL